MMSQLRTELNIKYCLAKDLRALSDANATKAGLVIAAGYNKGALEGDNNVRRFTPTFRPEKRLLIDDDGQDLIERLGSGNDAYAKVTAIQPADFHRHPDMFKRHFLKTAAPGGHPSAWTPACIICCGLGHQGFACGPYAALCKARNEAVPSGMLASYSYAYGCAPTRNSTTAAGQLHLTSLAQSFLSPDVGDPVRQPLTAHGGTTTRHASASRGSRILDRRRADFRGLRSPRASGVPGRVRGYRAEAPQRGAEAGG